MTIRRRMIEDGQGDAADLSGFAPVIQPQILRKHLGMTQSDFAKALRIPFSTQRIESRVVCYPVQPLVRC